MLHLKHTFFFLRGYTRTQAGRAWSFAFLSVIMFFLPQIAHGSVVYSQPIGDMLLSSSTIYMQQQDFAPPTDIQVGAIAVYFSDPSYDCNVVPGGADIPAITVHGFPAGSYDFGGTDPLTYKADDGACVYLESTGTARTMLASGSYDMIWGQSLGPGFLGGLVMYGSRFDVATGFYAASPPSDLTFVLFGSSTDATQTGTGIESFSTTTRIMNFSPADNSTTSAPFNLEFDYYINSETACTILGCLQDSAGHDVRMYDCISVSITYGTVSLGLPTVSTYKECDRYVGGVFTYAYYVDYLTHVTLPSSYFINASSTYIGDVFVTVQLSKKGEERVRPLYNYDVQYPDVWVFAIDRFTLPEESSISSPTGFGGLGYSGAAVSAVCNPATTTISTLYINTNFSASQCVSILFTPEPTLIKSYVTRFKGDLTTHFPVGYITDLVTILGTTSSSTITIINATVPSFIPGTGSNIRLDLNGVLNPILNATTSRYSNISGSSTQTFYQITSYYWNLIIYILCGFYIFRRILGKSLIPHFGHNTTFGKKGDNYKKL